MANNLDRRECGFLPVLLLFVLVPPVRQVIVGVAGVRQGRLDL